MRSAASILLACRVSAVILSIGVIGASPALAQQAPKADAAARPAVVAKPTDGAPGGAVAQRAAEPAPASKDGAVDTAAGREGASQSGSRGGVASAAARDGTSRPPTEKPYPWLMLVAFVVLPVLLLLTLHLVDSVQAYRFSETTRDKALEVLDGKLSAAQVLELTRLSPSGMAGTTRSIFTYGLLVVLGGAVFHLLVFSDAPQAPEFADKILTVLAGALSSVIGFYFGSKATSEGISSGAQQRAEPAPRVAAGITRIDPARAEPGQEVRIEGRGFGDAPGNVEFAGVAAPKTLQWTATFIRVEVPRTGHKGQATVTVNPADGSKIVGSGAPFEIV